MGPIAVSCFLISVYFGLTLATFGHERVHIRIHLPEKRRPAKEVVIYEEQGGGDVYGGGPGGYGGNGFNEHFHGFSGHGGGAESGGSYGGGHGGAGYDSADGHIEINGGGNFGGIIPKVSAISTITKSETSTDLPLDHTEKYNMSEICGTFCQFLINMFRAKARFPVPSERPEFYAFTYPGYYYCCDYVPRKYLVPRISLLPESELLIPTEWLDLKPKLSDTEDTSAATGSSEAATEVPDKAITVPDRGAPELVSLPVYPMHHHKEDYKEISSKLFGIAGVDKMVGPYEMVKRNHGNQDLPDMEKD